MSETQPLVIEERRGSVVCLALNRPERHHALNNALSDQLGDAILRASEDPEVAVLILTGTGDKAFCAGGDMLEMSGVEGAQEARSRSAGGLFGVLAKTPQPVIAAVNGYCFGGGARLAIGCDIRIASTTASFRLPGSEYGLVVAAASLPRLVGAARAKELIFTARKFDAREAFEYGLVTSLHEPQALMDAAWSMAETIASMSRSAVQEAKRVIDVATLSDEARHMEDDANRRLRGSPEQVERFRDATRRVTGR
ncbi:MAG: enoyl-CoA hydratase/isomerase family protein [Dehalococcoidia bacterium]|nr:enoyl-CoA hydratase/isomerase family protein [Dehalococcoidia bacterium]